MFTKVANFDETKSGDIPPNPPGLSENVNSLSETPEAMLKRVLLPEESVVATFDCFFPTFMLPKWQIVVAVVTSFGLYLFVLLYRWILRKCYAMKCCTPDKVTFQRGKLAVTNKGRIICWEADVEQIKVKRSCWEGLAVKLCCFCFGSLCDPTVNYSLKLATRIYSASSIRQITQFFVSESACPCCWCCCLDYETGMEVSFEEFGHNGRQCGIVSTSPKSGFINMISNLFQCAIHNFEASLAIGNDKILYVFSKTQDMVHNGDVNSSISDMNALFKQFLANLPKQPDVFIKSDDLIKDIPTKITIVDSFTEVNVVTDQGDVNIPSTWLHFLPDETIIAAHGELYKMKFKDWLLTILTGGLYYCFSVHHKKYNRTGLILTNKRLIAVDLNQRAGRIPVHLSEFSITIRSYFPGKVQSGWINSENRKDLTTGLLTDAGHIFIDFMVSGQKAIPFMKTLHLSVSREIEYTSLNSNIAKSPQLDATDLKFLPLMPGETPIDIIKGKDTWTPFCLVPSSDGYSTYLLCSRETLGPFLFPCVPYLGTLCIRPLKNRRDIVLTGKSLLYFSSERNYGIFGCFGALCPDTLGGKLGCNKGKFSASWTPLNKIIGFNSSIEVAGVDGFWSRICQSNCFGRLFCPIGLSELEINVDLGQYKFVVSDVENNKNWAKDDKLLHSDAILGAIQIKNEERIRESKL